MPFIAHSPTTEGKQPRKAARKKKSEIPIVLAPDDDADAIALRYFAIGKQERKDEKIKQIKEKRRKNSTNHLNIS